MALIFVTMTNLKRGVPEMSKYIPPTQSGIGQFFDSIFLLIAVYVSLLIPLFVDFGGDEAAEESAATVTHTWESLGQNATMQAQWEKLGMNVNQAAEIITDRFDYSIDPLSLILTAAVIIGYFVFLFRVSDKEYRDVLNEKFNNNG